MSSPSLQIDDPPRGYTRRDTVEATIPLVNAPADLQSKEHTRLSVAIVLTVPLILMALVEYFVPAAHTFLAAGWRPWLEMALALPVVFGCGRPFWTGAGQALSRRSADRDGLIALSSGAATAWSIAATIAPHGFAFNRSLPQAPLLFYNVAAALVTLALLARRVEVSAPGQRSASLNDESMAQSVDRVAGVWVAIVVAISILAFALWMTLGSNAERLPLALLAGVSVLVIACPCALGLAAPMAIKVALRRGARSGLPINGAPALHRLGELTTIVFDKTGTLTRGRPIVREIVTTGDFSQIEVLALAAAVESCSEHPLGAAIVRHAQRQSTLVPTARAFHSIEGQGVAAAIEAEGAPLQVLVGNTRLMHERGVRLTPFENAAAQLRIHGHTVVFVAVDGLAAGIIALADELRTEAARTVEQLHRLGLEVVMLTGDHRTSAQHTAHEAGIGWIVAEVLPGDKAREIEALQGERKSVAMVGDGLDDAALLAQADLGIALTGELGIAGPDAAITLLDGDLYGVVRAIELSRATQKTMRQNVWWAFAPHVLGIPLAAGLLPPFGAQLLFSMLAITLLSAIGVAANSLRLNRLEFRE